MTSRCNSSLPPSLPHSLTHSLLPLSLPPSHPPSFTHSSLPPSLPPSFTHSFLPPSLPPFIQMLYPPMVHCSWCHHHPSGPLPRGHIADLPSRCCVPLQMGREGRSLQLFFQSTRYLHVCCCCFCLLLLIVLWICVHSLHCIAIK